jgi:hypothetical protein
MLAQVCPPFHSSRRLANIRSNTFIPLAFHIHKTTRIPHSLRIENCGVVLHASTLRARWTPATSLSPRGVPRRSSNTHGTNGSRRISLLPSRSSAQMWAVWRLTHVRTLRLHSHLLCGVSVRLGPTLRVKTSPFLGSAPSIYVPRRYNRLTSVSLITSIDTFRLSPSTIHCVRQSLYIRASRVSSDAKQNGPTSVIKMYQHCYPYT